MGMDSNESRSLADQLWVVWCRTVRQSGRGGGFGPGRGWSSGPVVCRPGHECRAAADHRAVEFGSGNLRSIALC